ncbi:MAG TPA: prepilin-type N-terminal cleavage/methylation domain-containing protein [Candidatus Paceibacterota bacterium]|nr:prepilin-type N-terminal cleavage/methylation domain-containing protein [Candidatus Paceibacterota bacterium]
MSNAHRSRVTASQGNLPQHRSVEAGFTLIELLVVIAIIGILSSVVLASLNSARQKGRDARRVSDLKQLQLALELHFDTAGEYPEALSALTPDAIPVVPTDPRGTNYLYNNAIGTGACDAGTQTCTSYVLAADMEGPVPAGGHTGTIAEVACSTTGRYCVRP